MKKQQDVGALLTRLKSEETDAASYHSSELASVQAEAMRRYNGDPFGGEKEGRSQVVTPDVRDAINWALPTMLRPFMASEDFLTAVSNSSDTDLSTITDALAHVFFRDNNGEQILHDFAFDGLLQRVGIIRVSWDEPKAKPPRTMEGVSPEQVLQYESDPEYEILAIEQDGHGFMIEVQHSPKMGRCCIEAYAPEDFGISRRARSIDTAPYHCIIRRDMLLSEIKSMFPESASELDDAAYNDRGSDNGDGRLFSRFQGEAQRNVKDKDAGVSRVCLLEEYIRFDFDGDGVEELRLVKRVGDVILENIATEKPEISIWSPIPVAHRAIGQSLADLVIPYQRIRSEITRRMLDNMAQVLAPRRVVNIDALDGSDKMALDRFVQGGIGSVAPVRGDVRQAVADLTTPDVSSSAASALAYFDERKQEASGINANNQGIDPSAVHKTATGIDLIQSSSNARLEMMTRWFAYGLEGVFNRILSMLMTHQDQPRLLKIRGKPIQVTPSLWPDDLMISVHVGMANSTRDKQVANLHGMMALQEKIVAKLGQDNPLCGLKELRNSIARVAEIMGYKDATAFVKEIPDDYQAPPPAPDPKQAEQAAKLELAKVEQAAKLQLEREKAEAELQLARAKVELEMQLAREKMAADLAFRRDEAQLRAETDRMLGAHRRLNGSPGSSEPAEEISSNRPGGQLDA